MAMCFGLVAWYCLGDVYVIKDMGKNVTSSNQHTQCGVNEMNTVDLKKKAERITQQGFHRACCGNFGQYGSLMGSAIVQCSHLAAWVVCFCF